jgi:hypothetical protein
MSWIITSDQVSPPGDAAITYGITNAGGVFNLRSTGTVDYEAEWGDGNVEISTLNTLPHTYAAGDYSVVVYSDGAYRPYFVNVTADATQITSVVIGSGADLGTNLANAWRGASNMTTFTCPFSVTSSVTNFDVAWQDSSSLVSFPLLDFSSGTTFTVAWFSCSSLTTFPANMFDTTGTLVSSAFTNAWFGCALTAQSIENILVSLDTNGATGITLSIAGPNNAHTSTWSAAANAAWLSLDAKGWDINQNGPDPT